MTREELLALPYAKYQRTAHWKRLKEFVWIREQGRCALCNRDAKHLHHRSYRHRGDFKNEVMDCYALCARCHKTFHTYYSIKKNNSKLTENDLIQLKDGSYVLMRE